jgi:molybdate transport system substrate-binding protein
MRRLGALALAVLAIAGCGGGGGGSGSGSGKQSTPLTVAAASSLKTALLKYHSHERYSFAGSDILAAQIKGGARPDVYLAANTKLPDQLFKAGLLEKPVVFAGNRLVIAVPASAQAKVKSIADLAKPGVTIAAGSASVPIGSYTRQVIARLPAAQAKKILANIRSTEPDVSGVVGKLTQGAVDAGFVYATDVQAAGGKLAAIQIPNRLEPRVAYAGGVVKGTKQHHKASGFVKGLLVGRGASAFYEAGFAAPPTAGP